MILKKSTSSIHVQRSRFARTKTTADAILRANERSLILEDHAISRVDVCQLAANRPIEDFYSAGKCLNSNAYLFGVFDGHGGAACSRQVSARLFDYICASVLPKHTVMEIPLNERLQWLFSSADPILPSFVRDKHAQNVREFYERTKRGSEFSNVRKSLQSAFTNLDNDISNGAFPDSHGRVCRMSANVAASGSCALMAHIRRQHLHVANAGDSQAVLCINNHGNLMARQLSQLHTSENLDELSRVRSEHPVSESNSIIRGWYELLTLELFSLGDRLLGELIPLRAFGDVRYKWSMELQRVVLEPLGIPPPRSLHTPPYLTAMPEVFYHKLTPNDKFLILATDGLWEWLEPDTVVRLVSDHAVGAQTLSLYQPSVGRTLDEIAKDLEGRKAGESKKPIDDNSATHVIRSALGGVTGGTEKQYERLQESLQLPPGMARSWRDDITVIVVQFNSDYIAAAAAADKSSV
ncbi:[Pyruvate dehydrogenase [acetyl-transferring]]-phosphatase 1, mitochondrial [Aphelenchoides besseyi]|nr:[Pyruvate dehydrogenase [acetyl-transferring]]-phosphatase 1, mitochondrial [Aphelenchoides besseyi]